MQDDQGPLRLAEHVAETARGLGIETALIGAYALAAHDYVRATADLDLATVVQLDELRALRGELEVAGLHTALTSPDEQDDLGGTLTIWEQADEDGAPIEPVEIVNFLNVLRPRVNPAAEAIELLQRNRDVDVELIRATCKRYGLDKIDKLIEVAARRLR